MKSNHTAARVWAAQIANDADANTVVRTISHAYLARDMEAELLWDVMNAAARYRLYSTVPCPSCETDDPSRACYHLDAADSLDALDEALAVMKKYEAKTLP